MKTYTALFDAEPVYAFRAKDEEGLDEAIDFFRHMGGADVAVGVITARAATIPEQAAWRAGCVREQERMLTEEEEEGYELLPVLDDLVVAIDTGRVWRRAKIFQVGGAFFWGLV